MDCDRLAFHLTEIERRTSLLLHAFTGIEVSYAASRPVDLEAFHVALKKVHNHIRGLRAECAQPERS